MENNVCECSKNVINVNKFAKKTRIRFNQMEESQVRLYVRQNKTNAAVSSLYTATCIGFVCSSLCTAGLLLIDMITDDQVRSLKRKTNELEWENYKTNAELHRIQRRLDDLEKENEKKENEANS